MPLLVAVVSLLGLAEVARQRFADSAPAGSEDAPAVVGLLDAAATTALLVHTDGAGGTTGFTAVSLHDAGEARVVFVPASTMMEVPGFGLDTLANAGALGGVDLATLAVENLLTLRFHHVVALSPAAMSELTRSFDPLLVENPGRIDARDTSDRIEVLYPHGAMLLASSSTGDFLSRRGLEESDLDRMVRHQEFWEAYLLARSEVVGDDRDIQNDVEAFLDELAMRRDTTEYRILDVQTIGGEDELYGVDRSNLPASIIALDPGRSDEEPTSVQLLNGVGTPGLAAPLTERLVEAGASVRLTANAGRFDHETTQIVYYRDEQFGAARSIQASLGVGELVKAIDPIDVVDVTVVVGADLASTVTPRGRDVGPLVVDATPTTADDVGSRPISGQNGEIER